MKKINKVLIANRGEIAVRILRTLKRLGIKSVAIHSEADTKAMHVSFADESVCVGPANASSSYNNIQNIISAADLTRADAIHPGYGFLSEDAKFADIVEHHNITFLGPTSEQIEQMGNKMIAKKFMQEAGVPVVPGSEDAIEDPDEAYEIAKNMELPILFKATECGGGRGQRIVRNKEEIKEMFIAAQNEAFAISRKKGVFIESYFENPRHIEFQIIGDGKGNVICLGTRDCSVQRRHQKVMEEGPARIDKTIETDISKKICAVLGKLKYRSAGTVEFLECRGKLYFIEMNTRIQVEHPVTEAITGLDLIELQIRVAQGQPLPKQSDIKIRGHAMEARITAEDPFEFTPNPGMIEQFLAPGGPNVRVDGALYPGWFIPPWYDSLATKIISFVPNKEGSDSFEKTRSECIKMHRQALEETTISGIKTSIPLQLWILDQLEFQEGKISTQWLEKALQNREKK